MKVANDGLVYVCDRVNDRIQVFRRDGSFVQEFIQKKQTRGAGSAWDLYLWPDRTQSHFVTADGENNEVRVVRRQDGEVVGTFGRYRAQRRLLPLGTQHRNRLRRQCVHQRGRQRQARAEIPPRERHARKVMSTVDRVRLHPPFRAEHIGSFLRPAALLKARTEHAAGRVSDAELRAAEDRAIADFVALQERLGFRVVTDGEFRRSTYTSNFTTEGLTGVTADHKTGDAWSYTNASGHKEPARIPAVHARIRWNNSTNAADFATLAGMTRGDRQDHPARPLLHPFSRRPRAASAARPIRILRRSGRTSSPPMGSNCRNWPTPAAATFSLTRPRSPSSATRKSARRSRRAAMTGSSLLDQYIEVINAIVAQCPAGMRIGLHLCRGNRMGHWQAEGGYDLVADKLFRACVIDFFFLEYDSARAGSFEPLKAVPAHKAVVLGLLSTKVAKLEDEDFVEARVRAAARIIGLERLAISPQCGFSSSDAANTVMNRDQALAKLARVVEVARKIWGE